MKRFALAALAALAFSFSAFGQNPDLTLNPGSSYVDIGRGIPWSSFNRTYVLVPNSPNASVCVYVVNNNPTSAHTFTTAMFQTADSQVQDFSNNQGRYLTVPIIGIAGSVSASGLTSGFSQSTAAAKIAIKFTGASAQAGSPDTADVFAVQTTSGTCGAASVAISIQGTTPVGLAVTGNPVLIGGKDQNGNARFAQVAQSATQISLLDAIAFGGSQQAFSAGASVNGGGMKYPAGSNDGPLIVTPYIGIGNAGSSAEIPFGTQNQGCSQASGTGCAALFTADAGFVFKQTINNITASGTSFSGWITPGGQNAVLQACSITLQIVNTAGTTPTLDAFLQDSPDQVNWNDRIHFTQATTGTLRVTAGIAGGAANKTVATLTSGTIAAGTIVSGPLDQFGRILVNVGGTTPSYNVTAWYNCN